MERLCERPGCSDPASVAYGMRPEDLVFWLDVLRDRSSTQHGVLCRRHADSMVVPRNWTLDDLREPDLHLFRPPNDDSGPIARPRRRRPQQPVEHEQLAFGVSGASEPTPPVADGSLDASGEMPDVAATGAPADAGDEPVGRSDDGTGADDRSVDSAEGSDEPTDGGTPWMPVFDTDDDLDGLLAARSPLLSRAFRGERQG